MGESEPSDTPLRAIEQFRKALWRLSQHMGRIEFYDKHGLLVVSSDWTNAEGESLWGVKRATEEAANG